MQEAFFLTRLHSHAVRGRLLDARFEAVRVDRAAADLLITRNHLTPYSIDPAGSGRYELRSVPLERVTVCRGTLEEPTVLNVSAGGCVYWLGAGWLSGAGQAVAFAGLAHALVSDTVGVAVEEHALCRVETVTLDDIVRLSGLG